MLISAIVLTYKWIYYIPIHEQPAEFWNAFLNGPHGRVTPLRPETSSGSKNQPGPAKDFWWGEPLSLTQSEEL